MDANRSNFDRKTQISEILKKRSPLVETIQEVENNLNLISSKFDELERLGDQISKSLGNTKVSTNLKRLALHQLRQNIQSRSEELSKLKLRFSRNTLSIGVVGRARQGKSRLLQSLTGLTPDEIPDGRRGFCTGVRSNIYHCPGKETHGVVNFYPEQIFLNEVIGLYYEALGSTDRPSSIDDFEKFPPKSSSKDSAKLQTMYRHLIDDYHANLGGYRHLLDSQVPLKISKSDIRKYVAQDDQQGNPYFNYLAVREVDIFCEFPNADLGQIVLVDMPGLGDTRLGDEQRLMQALEQDVDFVLFVRMPNSMGDDWQDFDEDLYDRASSSLKDLSRRSFLILNRTILESGDNLHNCERFKDTIDSKNIKVVQCEIADCSDKLASGSVLNKILDYLIANITKLDEEHLRSYQEHLSNLQRDIDAKLKDAYDVLTIYNEDTLFEDQFLDLWSRLTSALENLVERLSLRREAEEPRFKAQVEATIARCRSDKKIPSVNEIEAKRDLEESYKIAYYSYFPIIRAHLSQHFISLDAQLQVFLEDVKVEVTKVLSDEGRLSGLSGERGSRFLSAIGNLIPDRRTDGKLSQLKLGFQHLAEFNVSFAGIVQRQIRQHLDELTPDQNELPNFNSSVMQGVLENTIEWIFSVLIGYAASGASSIPLTQMPSREKILSRLEGMLQPGELEEVIDQILIFFSSLASDSNSIPRSKLVTKEKVIDSFYAEQIRISLNASCDEIINKCEQTLKSLLCEPNQIAYSMIREFVDLIRRTDGIEKDWRIFLKRQQLRVWSEFKQVIEYSEDRQEWMKLVKKVEELNQPTNSQLVK